MAQPQPGSAVPLQQLRSAIGESVKFYGVDEIGMDHDARLNGRFAQPQLGDHICLITDSVDDYLDFVALFTRNGLTSGHVVKVMVSTISPDAMRAWLTTRTAEAEAALADGRLAVHSARETYLVDGVFDPVRIRAEFDALARQAQRTGYPGIWASVDMAWAVGDSPMIARVMDHEAACNPLYLDRRMAAVCHYERRMFDSEALLRARVTHPLGDGQSEIRFARTPEGLRITGTADDSNHEAFAAVLDSLRDHAGPTVIDVAGLRLSDAALAGHLIALATDRAYPTTIRASHAEAVRLSELDGHPHAIIEPG
jgi:hypothetical protein